MIDIKQLFDDILEEQGFPNTKIIEIFKTGSQIFHDNPNDLDFVAICSNYPKGYFRKFIKIDGIDYDLVIRDETVINDLLSFNTNGKNEGFNQVLLHNYFYCLRDVIYGNWDYTWNIFQYDEQYREYMRTKYIQTVGKRYKREKLTKGWVHFYVILKILTNKSTVITDEMTKDIITLYTSNGNVGQLIDWIEKELHIK